MKKILLVMLFLLTPVVFALQPTVTLSIDATQASWFDSSLVVIYQVCHPGKHFLDCGSEQTTPSFSLSQTQQRITLRPKLAFATQTKQIARREPLSVTLTRTNSGQVDTNRTLTQSLTRNRTETAAEAIIFKIKRVRIHGTNYRPQSSLTTSVIRPKGLAALTSEPCTYAIENSNPYLELELPPTEGGSIQCKKKN